MFIIKIILLIVSLSIANTQNDCSPFGVRIQYGNKLIASNSSEKIRVSFNTYLPCPNSYLRVLGREGFRDIDCSSNKIAASADMNNFITYVQICSIQNEVYFGDNFYYNVYGWDAASQNDPAAGLTQYVNMNIIDPVTVATPIRILTLADWGVITTTGFTPIAESLRQVMTIYKFDLMMVDGDIAYDLDTNNGTQYIGFLQMIEQFVSKIPVVFVPGNHQNYSDDDRLLLNSTFILYGLSDNLVTGFQFGDIYILPFDPYKYLYLYPQTIISLDALKSQLAIAEQTGLFIIPFSHYALTCSGESSMCQSSLSRMHTYFDAMIDAGVTLYIGAHSHQYERIYPYYQNQTFAKIQSPYEEGNNYLVSIVEGVAGSNTDLVTTMQNKYNYTAVYTVNETGFGMLTVNTNNQIQYSHYSTLRGFIDSMVILKRDKSKNQQDKQNQSFKLHLSKQ